MFHISFHLVNLILLTRIAIDSKTTITTSITRKLINRKKERHEVLFIPYLQEFLDIYELYILIITNIYI